MSDRKSRKWVLSGCLIVLGVVVLAAGGIAVTTWLSMRSADPQSPVLVREVQPSEVAPRNGGLTGAGTPLNVRLELDSCEVYIEPGFPGEPLQVEAYYDAGDYRLEEFADEATPGDYRLRFVPVSSRLITGIKEGLRGGQPQIRIRLPIDSPLELSLLQRNGAAIVDLSGLNLRSADFDVGGALLKVDADQELQGELGRFSVKGSQGGLFVESLNLMRPREIDVDFSMGQVQLDFRGPWTASANIDLSLGIADAIVRLPKEIRVTGLETNLTAPSGNEELHPPTLSFTVESGRRTKLRVFE